MWVECLFAVAVSCAQSTFVPKVVRFWWKHSTHAASGTQCLWNTWPGNQNVRLSDVNLRDNVLDDSCVFELFSDWVTKVGVDESLDDDFSVKSYSFFPSKANNFNINQLTALKQQKSLIACWNLFTKFQRAHQTFTALEKIQIK